jgi:hypothetical protein
MAASSSSIGRKSSPAYLRIWARPFAALAFAQVTVQPSADKYPSKRRLSRFENLSTRIEVDYFRNVIERVQPTGALFREPGDRSAGRGLGVGGDVARAAAEDADAASRWLHDL